MKRSAPSSERFAKLLDDDARQHGLQLAAKDVHYALSEQTKEKPLLSAVNLLVEPGHMMALLGPSGAGKSTLLDVLAGRKRDGLVTGEVLFDGAPLTDALRPRVAYLMQDDTQMAEFTVAETLRFAARLRMSPHSSKAERDARVNEILAQFQLQNCAATRIGDQLNRGISGGEMRRLSIGCEVIAQPLLLLMDEPTSGLDSSSAQEVMECVKAMALAGTTVVATVHQPSDELFALFDLIALLETGRVLFAGPRNAAPAFFREVGFAPPAENACDFLLSVASEATTKRDGEIMPASVIVQTFAASHDMEELRARLAEVEPLEPHPPLPRSNWWQLTRLIFYRSLAQHARKRTDLRFRWGKSLFLGFTLSNIFWQMEEELANGYNIFSLCYIVTMFSLYDSKEAIAPEFSRRPLFLRERAAGVYGTSNYWAGTNMADFLPFFVDKLLLIPIMYVLVGLSEENFLYFFFVILLAAICTQQIAKMIATLCGTASSAFVIFPAFFIVVYNTCGFTVRLDSVPVLWEWATYVSPARWAFQGAAISQFEDGYAGEPAVNFLERFNFERWDKWTSVPILGLEVLLTALFFLAALQERTSRLREDASLRYWAFENTIRKLLSITAATHDEHERRASAAGLEELAGGPPAGAALDAPSAATAVPRVTIAVRALSARVLQPEHNVEKQVLFDLHGIVPAQTLCAVMGPSGAGKSSLIDVLAGRRSRIDGDVLFNGQPFDAAVRDGMAYVMQADVHIAQFTVLETLEFAARLRMPPGTSPAARAERIDYLLSVLNLRKAANTRVGLPGSGISGGERKRLSVAVEITNLPSLILLDEPTTGLDSTMAMDVVQAVRQLTQRGHTVVCSIHQPSEELFATFDLVWLLRDGRTAFHGAPARSAEYFHELGFQNDESNPANFVLAATSGALPLPDGRKPGARELSGHFEKSPDSAELRRALEADAAREQQPLRPTSRAYSELLRVTVGIERTFKKHWRMTKVQKTRFWSSLGTALFLGSLYWQLTDDATLEGGFNRMAACLYFFSYAETSSMAALPAQFEERTFFLRERASGAASNFSFWCSHFVPLVFGVPYVLMFGTLVYFMSGLDESGDRFPFFLLILILGNWVGIFFIQTMAALTLTVQRASPLFTSLQFVLLCFSGFVVRNPTIPAIWSWVPSISLFRWGMQGLVINEFDGNQFGLYTTEEWYETYGFEGYSKWDSVPALLLIMAVFRILTMLGLKFRAYQTRQ